MFVSRVLWCVRCGVWCDTLKKPVCGQKNWKAPNRILVMRDSTDRWEAKVFRAHAVISALKLLAIEQKDGDSPVNIVVEGVQEKSRLKIMDGLKRFLMVGQP